MWADEVATFLSACEDERSQEQLDGIPFERKTVPLSPSIIPGTRLSVYTQTSSGGAVPVAHATRLQRRVRGAVPTEPIAWRVPRINIASRDGRASVPSLHVCVTVAYDKGLFTKSGHYFVHKVDSDLFKNFKSTGSIAKAHKWPTCTWYQ